MGRLKKPRRYLHRKEFPRFALLQLAIGKDAEVPFCMLLQYPWLLLLILEAASKSVEILLRTYPMWSGSC
jgi:hypothetical protein